MDRRSISNVALALSAGAVLVALIVLSVRVRAVAEEPEIDPIELARAAAASRSAAGTRLPTAAREAPPAPDPSRAALDRPRPARAAERQLAEEPPASSPTARAAPAGEEAAVSQASEYYGTGDYENALALATEFLKQDPDNERMLRIAASSLCILGNGEQARPYFERLTPRGQREIRRRCGRYGVDL